MAPRVFPGALAILVVAASCRPGQIGGGGVAPEAPVVAISEVMYHPVLENDAQDNHEFVEVHNPSAEAVTVAGWRLALGGRPAFQFPPDAVIPPGGYLVVARDRARLAALAGLPAGAVLGDLQRGLDNGGDDVALLDGAAAVVDLVKYDDQPPWPVGADALGAGRGWFPAGEYEKQQYRGRSLERRSFTVAATEPRNWEASALGGGTPGRANGATGDPAAIVMSHTAGGADGLAVKKGERAVVRATLSRGDAGELSVEWFVDDLARPDDMEAKMAVPMRAAGAGGEQVAELPVLPERSIVRYRILARRGGRPPEPIAPRPGDLAAYHATYVQPDPAPAARSYQLFIAPANWMRMWTQLGPGPNAACELNPSWDARVPAVVVHDGRVYDVLVRHQGSRYQRRNGFNLPALPGIGPVPGGKAFSWRLSFPSSAEWGRGTGDRRGTVTLNKQHQACPGVINHLESKLHWAAGTRTQRFKFARLYVNGAYYNYSMEIEDVDEDLLDKTNPPGAAMGDLFKADGAIDDNQGPWGRANFLPLAPNATCPARWSVAERYRFTYERQSHEWKDATPAGHEELVRIVEGLRPLADAAKLSGDWRPVRAHLEKHFDVPQLLTHWVVRNFAGVWDDGAHNFYLYRRATDGIWEAYPQDFDLDFGGFKPANMTIFAGEEGAGQDPVGGPNHLKSALIKAFRDEFRARFVELVGSVLRPDNVNKLLDEAIADWDQRAWEESPAVGRCDMPAKVAAARAWLTQRYAFLQQQGIR
jgi:hypothetical protein